MFAEKPWYVVRRDNGEVYVRNRHGILADRLPPTRYQGQQERFETETKEYEANAHLIAAAPDMYEALANLENDDEHMPPSAWKLVQDALAKARGEPSE